MLIALLANFKDFKVPNKVPNWFDLEKRKKEEAKVQVV